MTACASCGQDNAPDAQFCAECGEYLGWSSGAPAAPRRPDRPGSTTTRRPTRRRRPATAPPHRLPRHPPAAGTHRPRATHAHRRRPTARRPAPPAPRPDPRATARGPGRHRAPDPAPAGRRSRPGRDPPRPAADPSRAPPAPEPAAPPTDLARVARALDEGRRLAERQNRPDLGNHLRAGPQAARRAGAERRRRRGVQAGQEHAGQRPAADRRLPHRRRHRHRRAHRRPVRPGAVGRRPARAVEPTGRRLARRPAPSTSPSTSTGSPTSSPRPPTRAGGAACAPSRSASPTACSRRGLSLVDTPGVGGLESAHGIVTLGALRATVGVIFVTDASQELTGPEVEFLRQALERCPAAVCVVTKTDLYPAWRRIVELDRQHLSERRHRPAGDPRVVVPAAARVALPRAERGVGLRAAVRLAALRGAGGRRHAGGRRRRRRDLGFAQEQLRLEVAAEQQVLAKPEASAEVVGALRRRSERTRKLVERGNGWQQFLVRRHRPADRRRQARPGRPDADGRARRRGRHRPGRPQGHLAGHRGVAAAPGGARREREPRAAQRARRAARGGRRRDVRAGVRGAAEAGADRARRRAARARRSTRPSSPRPDSQKLVRMLFAGARRAHPGDARGLRGERRRRPAPAGGGRAGRRDRGRVHRPQADPRRAPAAADLPPPAGEDLAAGATSTRPTS